MKIREEMQSFSTPSSNVSKDEKIWIQKKVKLNFVTSVSVVTPIPLVILAFIPWQLHKMAAPLSLPVTALLMFHAFSPKVCYQQTFLLRG